MNSKHFQDGDLNLTGFVDHEVADVDLEEKPSPRLVGANSFMTKAQVTKEKKVEVGKTMEEREEKRSVECCKMVPIFHRKKKFIYSITFACGAVVP